MDSHDNVVDDIAEKEDNKSLAMELLQELKRQNKRLVVALFTVLVMWLITIVGFMWYLNQYDFVSYDVISGEGGNANYIGNDGDIYNGTSDSEDTN